MTLFNVRHTPYNVTDDLGVQDSTGQKVKIGVKAALLHLHSVKHMSALPNLPMQSGTVCVLCG